MSSNKILIIILFIISLALPCAHSYPADKINKITGSEKKLITKGIKNIETAYKNWDKEQFQSSISYFKQMESSSTQCKAMVQYWVGTAYFFTALHDLYSADKDPDKQQAEDSIEKGIKELNQAIELMPDFSESYALRGVLRGMLIKIKPSSMIFHGRKVGADRKQALELNRTNPRVHYLTGVSLWHTPELFGRKKQALEHLLTAVKLFQNEKQMTRDNILPSWGYSTCLAFIGNFYTDTGNSDMAEKYYKKSLDIEPEDPLALRGLNKLKIKED